MKHLLLLLLSISTTALAAPENRDIGKPDTSLFDRVNQRYQAIAQGVSFYYITQADRVRIVSEFFHSVESDYALLEFKLKRFAIDLPEFQRASIAAETAIPDTEVAAEQANSNLKFLDRFQKIVATFQDTHFGVRPRVAMMPVILPFTLAEAEGKFIVATRFPKLLSYLASKDPAFGSVNLGDEVVSIDGVPTAQAREKLLPYISASSDLYREREANTALTYRSFALPERGHAIVELRDKDGNLHRLKFPWMHRTSARGDQTLYFKSRGFFRYDELRMEWDEQNKKWLTKGVPQENAEPFHSLPPLADQKEYSVEGDVILKTGYLVLGGRAFGMLQINGFHVETVADAQKTSLKFLDVMRAFIRRLEAEDVPLIIDLRVNGGGNGKYPAALLSMLTEKDKVYAGPTDALRVTRNSMQLIDEELAKETMPEELSGYTQEQLRAMMNEAIENHATHTSAFSDSDVKPDPEVGGFSQKIAVLISPSCISACDMAASLFKHSGRATLIGTPTNGTGAGFLSSDSIDSAWTDSYRVFRSQIPNFLFGKPGGEPGTYIFPGMAESLNLENRPTVPDVEYKEKAVDILNGSVGVLVTAIKSLVKE